MICPYCQSKKFVELGNYVIHSSHICDYMFVKQDHVGDGFTPIFIDWARGIAIKADGSFYSNKMKSSEMKFKLSSVGSEENLKEITDYIEVFMQNLKILS